MKKDWFQVTYDPGRVTPERMLEAARAEGFRAEVIPDAPVAATPAPAVRRDMTRLPETLRQAVRQARKDGKPLLLAFHGPG